MITQEPDDTDSKNSSQEPSQESSLVQTGFESLTPEILDEFLISKKADYELKLKQLEQQQRELEFQKERDDKSFKYSMAVLDRDSKSGEKSQSYTITIVKTVLWLGSFLLLVFVVAAVILIMSGYSETVVSIMEKVLYVLAGLITGAGGSYHIAFKRGVLAGIDNQDDLQEPPVS